MDSRCAQLLIKLRDSGHPITIKELADDFKVSMRTIRYDLQKIDSFLLEHKLPQLMHKPHTGIQLGLSQQEKVLLNKQLIGIGNYHYILSPKERRKYILAELIEHKNFITIQDLADELSVSRSTIISDMKDLRKWLAPFEIQIESKTKKGIRINGKEKSIRKVMLEVISGDLDDETIVKELKTPSLSNYEIGLDEKIKNLFADIDIRFIEECIQTAEEELSVSFSDTAYSGIVLHIAMAIKRIQLGKDIVISHDELQSLTLTKEFSVASNVAKMLEKHFNISIPIDEIGYITIHMLGANSFQHKEDSHCQEYQILAQTLLGTMSQLTGINFFEDQILCRGLMEHIGPVVYRLQQGLSAKNPLLEEIRTTYSTIFEKTKIAVIPLENFVGKPMDEDEVGYFALHFAAAVERNSSKFSDKKIPHVLLVCSTGIGTAQILKARILMIFNVHIVDCIAAHNVEFFLSRHSVDLVISTITLPDLQVPAVTISPMLKEKDIERLRSYLDSTTPLPNVFYQKVLSIIEQTCEIKNKFALENQLKRLFDSANDGKGEPPMLKDLLTKQMIKVQVDAKDWEDAVYQGGMLLVQSGAAKPSYVEAMIHSVKKIGPYIVVAPGIAMPHARPETGAIGTGFSLITLKKSVFFGNKENDPVKIVVCLCSSDSKTHIKALSELVNLLGNDENVQTINNAASVETILQLIQQKAA